MLVWILIGLLVLVYIFIISLFSSVYLPEPGQYGHYTTVSGVCRDGLQTTYEICLPNSETGYGCLSGREMTFETKVLSQKECEEPIFIPVINPKPTLFPASFIWNSVSYQPGELFSEVGPSDIILSRKALTPIPMTTPALQETTMVLTDSVVLSRVYLDLYEYPDIRNMVKNRVGFAYNYGNYLSINPGPVTGPWDSRELIWSDNPLAIALIPTSNPGYYKLGAVYGKDNFGWIVRGKTLSSAVKDPVYLSAQIDLESPGPSRDHLESLLNNPLKIDENKLYWTPARNSTIDPSYAPALLQNEIDVFPIELTEISRPDIKFPSIVENSNLTMLMRSPSLSEYPIIFPLSIDFSMWNIPINGITIRQMFAGR
jgi:hypothetical protein